MIGGDLEINIKLTDKIYFQNFKTIDLTYFLGLDASTRVLVIVDL